MDKGTYPRPATALYPEMLKLSPKQTEVLATLQKYPRGARAAEIAEDLGMHVNTARGHLDELVAKGAVKVASSPAAGRGRPSLIFQVRVPDNRAITEEYIALINALVDMLKDSADSSDALELANRIGIQWAKKLGEASPRWATPADALAELSQRLRDMGFDPHMRDAAEVELHACPFVTASGKRPEPFICAVHEGLLKERTACLSGNAVRLELKRFTPTETCSVKVTATEDEPPGGQGAR